MSEGEKRPTPDREPQADDPPVAAANVMGRGMRILLGAYLAAVCGLLLYLFGEFWPSDLKGAKLPVAAMVKLFWWKEARTTTAEIQILVLVLCAGAMGSMLHAVQSFVTFHGSQSLAKSWLPWYLLRPFVGALLALIFYLLIRGGLIAGVPSSGETQFPVNVIGIVSAAALVGMFSDLASLKLKEVFSTMFASNVKRADPLPSSATTAKPLISGTEPSALTKGRQVGLRIRGKNFVRESKVSLDGQPRETKYVSPGELMAVIEPTDVADAGTRKITVVNPEDRGGVSDPWETQVS